MLASLSDWYAIWPATDEIYGHHNLWTLKIIHNIKASLGTGLLDGEHALVFQEVVRSRVYFAITLIIAGHQHRNVNNNTRVGENTENFEKITRG